MLRSCCVSLHGKKRLLRAVTILYLPSMTAYLYRAIKIDYEVTS